MVSDHIDRVLRGDTDAFQYIISEYKDKSYTLAISVLKNENAARDAVQNAFIKAFNNLHTYRRESEFSSWLYRIVINEAFMYLRKNNREREVKEEFASNLPEQDLNDVLIHMKRNNQKYYINATLNKLPANYSLALRLYYLFDYSIKEVSDMTGWTDSNTKIILYRARNKAKTILTDIIDIDKEELL